jgi:hypothetical protein
VLPFPLLVIFASGLSFILLIRDLSRLSGPSCDILNFPDVTDVFIANSIPPECCQSVGVKARGLAVCLTGGLPGL